LVTAFAGAACCPRYFATLSSFSFMGCGVFGRGAKKKIHGLEGVPPPSSSVRQDPTSIYRTEHNAKRPSWRRGFLDRTSIGMMVPRADGRIRVSTARCSRYVPLPVAVLSEDRARPCSGLQISKKIVKMKKTI
jgi:hypothetical protein